jgi:hypothetical protein
LTVGGVEASEVGADLVSVGVVEVIEDDQGLLPGVTAASGLPVALWVLPRLVRGVGLFIAVTKIPKQGEGLVVAGDGVRVIAEVVGVAEAVPGAGLPFAMVEVNTVCTSVVGVIASKYLLLGVVLFEDLWGGWRRWWCGWVGSRWVSAWVVPRTTRCGW